MDAMRKHLVRWWEIAILYKGPPVAIWSRNIQSKWRPLLLFQKPPIRPAPDWLVDCMEGGGREKTLHDWQQSQNESEYLIDKLTLPGALIVDPFAGAGTVPMACKALGRRWLATEIDPKTAARARKRLAET